MESSRDRWVWNIVPITCRMYTFIYDQVTIVYLREVVTRYSSLHTRTDEYIVAKKCSESRLFETWLLKQSVSIYIQLIYEPIVKNLR